jgi:hypothetical protein
MLSHYALSGRGTQAYAQAACNEQTAQPHMIQRLAQPYPETYSALGDSVETNVGIYGAKDETSALGDKMLTWRQAAPLQ